MIIKYYEYMTTQYFVRFFFIHLKPRVETFWGVLIYILLLSRLTFEQKRFAGRHLLTFETQKLNYFCEKEKDKANKRILRSLSFDNNDLVKPSCGTVALYGPFVFF
jgi:hypothetical protein